MRTIMWTVAVTAVVACTGSPVTDSNALSDTEPTAPADTRGDDSGTDATDSDPCHAPNIGMDPVCPEGGEVRMERIIGADYRLTAFLKRAQSNDATPPGFMDPMNPTCVVCDADSDHWMCTIGMDRAYVQAGTLTVSDGEATDIVREHCAEGRFAGGRYVEDQCQSGTKGIAVDAFARSHPDGAYIGQGPYAGTPVERSDHAFTFSFAGDADGYPAQDFDVYMPPDFTVQPTGTGVLDIDEGQDLTLSWNVAAADNLPAGTRIMMMAMFVDDGPPPINVTPGENRVNCMFGEAVPGTDQSWTIPAKTVRDMLPKDGVMLRGAVWHQVSEYDDGTTRGRRIDRVGQNCYSQPYRQVAPSM